MKKNTLGGVLSGVLLGALLCGVLLYQTNSATTAQLVEVAPRSVEEQQTIDVYEKTNEAVAFISTVSLSVDPFDLFLSLRPREGSGSGTVIDGKRGIILTNLHVVRDAQKVEITLADEKSYTAKLIGYDEVYDLAVLRLDNPPSGLRGLDFADSSQLAVGQRVLAIGNPFGLHRTLTEGIISSLDRAVRSSDKVLMRGLIQTDAAINPGNSGGPLLDTAGRLVGINTAILSQSGDSAGIGFAVPVNRIRQVLPDLIRTGRVVRHDPGWVLADSSWGPVVRWIDPDGAAAQVGIEPLLRVVQRGFVRGVVKDYDRADVVVSVNGSRVDTKADVEIAVIESNPRKPIELVVRRGRPGSPTRKVTLPAVAR